MPSQSTALLLVQSYAYMLELLTPLVDEGVPGGGVVLQPDADVC